MHLRTPKSGGAREGVMAAGPQYAMKTFICPARLLAMTCAFAMAVLCGPAARATAQTADGLLGKMLACRAVPLAKARLSCFDRAAALLARQGMAPVRPAMKVASPQQTFGLTPAAILAREVSAGKQPKPLAKISSTLASLNADADGRMIYHLANGQSWRELQNDGDAPPVHVGERLEIYRGWLGSYWMQTASGRGCKVERIR